MWECQFDRLLPKIANCQTSLIPDILKKIQTETDIISGINNETLFGFILCDISSPDSVAKKMASFPPIIKRQVVTKEHLTPYMLGRIAHEKPEVKNFERETLIQCFNAKNHLLMTPLAKYYMDKGLKITNITKFVQYIPRRALSPFVKHVTNMRIEAETAVPKKTTKGNTAKIFGNSGYGKVNLNLIL